MEIAAIILSALALTTSCGSLIWQLAKHWSTHKLEFVPLEKVLEMKGDMPKQNLDIPLKKDKTNPSFSEMYREIGEVDPEEMDYFKKHNSHKSQTH